MASQSDHFAPLVSTVGPTQHQGGVAPQASTPELLAQSQVQGVGLCAYRSDIVPGAKAVEGKAQNAYSELQGDL